MRRRAREWLIKLLWFWSFWPAMVSAQNLTAKALRLVPSNPGACPGNTVCVIGTSSTSPYKVAFQDVDGNLIPMGEAWNLRLVAGAPPSPQTGWIWYDTVAGTGMVRAGGSSVPFGTTASNVLTALAAASSSIDVNSQRIVDVATPLSATDAANKAYVDALEKAFLRVCTLTSAAAATPVTCLADADVPTGKKAYVGGVRLKVNGGTGWGTVTSCALEDSGGVDFLTVPVGSLTANALLRDSDSASLTAESALALGSGTTTAMGLRVACNANGTGSDIVWTAWGTIR